MRALRVLIFIVVILSLPLVVIAGQKKSKKKLSSPYSSVSFDLTQEKLPPNFIGHDLFAMYKSIELWKSKEPKKDKFETSEQFEKRLEKHKDMPISSKFALHDLFVTSESAKLDYDADTQKTSVVIRTANFESSPYLQNNQPYCCVGGKQLSSSARSGHASNAFGAIVEVQHSSTKSVALAMVNPQAIDLDKHKNCATDVRFTLPTMSVEAAKSLQDSLSVAIIFTLKSPFSDFNFSGRSATIDSPYSDSNQKYYVVGSIVEVWVYNKQSGQVLLKKKY